MTVGYERIRGLRLPGQMADGTFSANKSAMIAKPPESLRAMLLDDVARAELLPSLKTVLRSKPTSKNIRIRIGADSGFINVALSEVAGDRLKVTIQHTGLAFPGEIERWKAFWTECLETLDTASQGQGVSLG